jgi:hypothetical protein
MSTNNFLTRFQKQRGFKNILWIVGITLAFSYILAINTPLTAQKGFSSKDAPIEQQKKSVKSNYPSSFDWRNVNGENFVTPVKNQAATLCNSCVAFATAAALEANAVIQLKLQVKRNGDVPVDFDLSEAQLFFCNSNCYNGWAILYALGYCQDPGVLSESSCKSYSSIVAYCEKHCLDPCTLENSERFQKACCNSTKDTFTKITDYKELGSKEAMKKWISSKGPVIASMCIDENFLKWKGEGVYKCQSPCNRPENHFICCIGYDDKENAWLCKNSFGTDWGVKGYFWIGYDECGINNIMFGITGFSKIYIPPKGSKAPPSDAD